MPETNYSLYRSCTVTHSFYIYCGTVIWASGRLTEVKNNRKIQIASVERSRDRLREVWTIVIWLKKKFGILEKWSLRRGVRTCRFDCFWKKEMFFSHLYALNNKNGSFWKFSKTMTWQNSIQSTSFGIANTVAVLLKSITQFSFCFTSGVLWWLAFLILIFTRQN